MVSADSNANLIWQLLHRHTWKQFLIWVPLWQSNLTHKINKGSANKLAWPWSQRETWSLLSWSVPKIVCCTNILWKIVFFFFLTFCKILFIFYWRIIALQCFVVFCQTATWVSHRYSLGQKWSMTLDKTCRSENGPWRNSLPTAVASLKISY